jgi:hypothetical protein
MKIIREDNTSLNIRYHYGYYNIYKLFIHHREDGPAIEYTNGDKYWYQNGNIHRDDGPAIEYADGDKSWCQNDKLHREDGPAVELANGNKRWYFNGNEIVVKSQEEYEKYIKYMNF